MHTRLATHQCCVGTVPHASAWFGRRTVAQPAPGPLVRR